MGMNRDLSFYMGRTLSPHRCCKVIVVLFVVMCSMGCADTTHRFTNVRKLDFQTLASGPLIQFLPGETDAALFPDRVTTVPYEFEDVWGGVQGVLKTGNDKIAIRDAKRGLIITEATRHYSIVLIPLQIKYCFLIQPRSPGFTTITYRFILHRMVRSESQLVIGKDGFKSIPINEVWEAVNDPTTILACQESIEAQLADEISKLPPAKGPN